MGNYSTLNSIHSTYLLDEAWSPVARCRLLSSGINTNTRLEHNSEVTADRGCLACGNCVDACPVVKQDVGLVFIQNKRTSMALENFVQEECRRCYRCVNSCPQVSKDVKEHVAGFRRGEKIVHLLAAFCIIALAVTGITHSHYGNVLGTLEAAVLKYLHRFIGVLSIIIPMLYYKLDINHFRRNLKNVFRWGQADVQWLKDTAAHIFSSKSAKKIVKREYNPGQKIWYLFIIFIFPALYLSGLAGMVLGSFPETKALINTKMFHMIFALCFDLMLFVHLYLKFVRVQVGQGYKTVKNYRDTKSLVLRGN